MIRNRNRNRNRRPRGRGRVTNQSEATTVEVPATNFKYKILIISRILFFLLLRTVPISFFIYNNPINYLSSIFLGNIICLIFHFISMSAIILCTYLSLANPFWINSHRRRHPRQRKLYDRLTRKKSEETLRRGLLGIRCSSMFPFYMTLVDYIAWFHFLVFFVYYIFFDKQPGDFYAYCGVYLVCLAFSLPLMQNQSRRVFDELKVLLRQVEISLVQSDGSGGSGEDRDGEEMKIPEEEDEEEDSEYERMRESLGRVGDSAEGRRSQTMLA